MQDSTILGVVYSYKDKIMDPVILHVYICVVYICFVNMCIRVCVCVCVCVDRRGQYLVSSLIALHLIFLRQNLSLNL